MGEPEYCQTLTGKPSPEGANWWAPKLSEFWANRLREDQTGPFPTRIHRLKCDPKIFTRLCSLKTLKTGRAEFPSTDVEEAQYRDNQGLMKEVPANSPPLTESIILNNPTSSCQSCGVEFIPKLINAKFCRNTCRQKAYRQRCRILTARGAGQAGS